MTGALTLALFSCGSPVPEAAPTVGTVADATVVPTPPGGSLGALLRETGREHLAVCLWSIECRTSPFGKHASSCR